MYKIFCSFPSNVYCYSVKWLRTPEIPSPFRPVIWIDPESNILFLILAIGGAIWGECDSGHHLCSIPATFF